jgi:hypothetical protein
LKSLERGARIGVELAAFGDFQYLLRLRDLLFIGTENRRFIVNRCLRRRKN